MIDRELEELIEANRARWSGLQPIDQALRNTWNPPYLPSDDRSHLAAEYNQLIDNSRLNLLRLVVDALVDRLHAVGFRTSQGDTPDEQVWGWWQASALDQRQILVHRDAAAFGDGFLLVTPGGDIPLFRPESPLTLAVEFDPYDPELVSRAAKQVGDMAWFYLPDEILAFRRRPATFAQRWQMVERTPHAAGVCPVVRFANNLDSMGRSMSEVEPVLPVQQRIHQTLFDRMLLQRSQAWRQRWVSGITVDRDDAGQPLNPFRTGADRLLVGDNPDVKFGEFQQANLDGLLRAVDDDIRAVALITRTPPHYLPGSSIANISAEALTALEAALASRVNERKALWGEAWERAMRVGGAMVGVDVPDEAEVVWANLELQSEAQRVDAAVKLAAIGVPLAYLLERLSLTPQEIDRVLAQADIQAVQGARAQAAAFGMPVEAADAGPDTD